MLLKNEVGTSLQRTESKQYSRPSESNTETETETDKDTETHNETQMETDANSEVQTETKTEKESQSRRQRQVVRVFHVPPNFLKPDNQTTSSLVVTITLL